MDYQTIKSLTRDFARKHEAYTWFAIEFSTVCGAAFCIPGLITAATGAMAAGNLWLMLLEYMLVPIYTGALFALVTGVIAMILIVPYALLFGRNPKLAKKPKKAKTSSLLNRKPA